MPITAMVFARDRAYGISYGLSGTAASAEVASVKPIPSKSTKMTDAKAKKEYKNWVRPIMRQHTPHMIASDTREFAASFTETPSSVYGQD
jgi:hypothetical protein